MPHGGIVPAFTTTAIVSRRVNTSSYDVSGNGAMLPGVWQALQWRSTSGRMSRW
jgi:hypothetical protein